MGAIEKSSKAFRTIREVADELSLEPHVLRFWEKEFPQIKPMQRDNGRRYYRLKDVDKIRHIQTLLHHEGYTIKGAKAVLSGKVTPSDSPQTPIAKNHLHRELKELHQSLLHIRKKLTSALS